MFLDSIIIEPIIDVKTFNAALFEFAPDLVRHFRRQGCFEAVTKAQIVDTFDRLNLKFGGKILSLF